MLNLLAELAIFWLLFVFLYVLIYRTAPSFYDKGKRKTSLSIAILVLLCLGLVTGVLEIHAP